MTPKEKAEELVLRFSDFTRPSSVSGGKKQTAQICALIAVDEIIYWMDPEDWGIEMEKAFEKTCYWQEVKQEIEKL